MDENIYRTINILLVLELNSKCIQLTEGNHQKTRDQVQKATQKLHRSSQSLTKSHFKLWHLVS